LPRVILNDSKVADQASLIKSTQLWNQIIGVVWSADK